jgi:hypothetical protein
VACAYNEEAYTSLALVTYFEWFSNPSFAPFHFFQFSSVFRAFFSAFSFQNTKSFSFPIMSRRSSSRGHNSASSSSNAAVMDLYPVDEHFSLNRWMPQLALGEDITILFKPKEHLSHQARNGEVNLQEPLLLHFQISFDSNTHMLVLRLKTS